ncbi:MAG: sulfatase [Proteobacteria bacterium]|nr:sulfatase [Pseudomonadota bacterium]
MRLYLLALFFILNIILPAVAADSKPNIIYILADDLGWKDVGFHGGVAKTPNIDLMAKQGARLERFYTLPYSTPTRAALLTGRYPLRYGLQMMSILPWNTYGISETERLLPEALKTAGYSTAAFGEWRLGHAKKKFFPTERGFDYFFGSLNKGRKHFKSSDTKNLDWWEGEEQIDVEGYDAEIIAKSVKDYINDNANKTPFFLYISFPNPAFPFEAPEKYLQSYRDIANKNQRNYYAMVSALDYSVGKIIESLREQKLENNTLIIFHSDNGGAVKNKYKTGDGDVPLAVANNGPFFNGKGSLYEGAVRVPALAYWPSKIKPQMTNELIHVTDMYNTLLTVAGASLSSDEQVKPTDGVNAWSVISEGRLSARKEILLNVDEFRGALISNNWKLIVYATLPARFELFNIQDDPTEENNRSRTEPEIVKKLLRRFNDFAWEMAPSEYLKDLARPHENHAPIFWRNNPTRP